jgi:hypothetical protein
MLSRYLFVFSTTTSTMTPDGDNVAAAAGMPTLHFHQQIAPVAVDHKVKGLQSEPLGVLPGSSSAEPSGVRQQRLPCLVDGDVRNPRCAEVLLERSFIMVTALGHR